MHMAMVLAAQGGMDIKSHHGASMPHREPSFSGCLLAAATGEATGGQEGGPGVGGLGQGQGQGRGPREESPGAVVGRRSTLFTTSGFASDNEDDDNGGDRDRERDRDNNLFTAGSNAALLVGASSGAQSGGNSESSTSGSGAGEGVEDLDLATSMGGRRH